MGNKITFYEGTPAQYAKVAQKNSNGIYFVSPETGKSTGTIYKGDVPYGGTGDLPTATKSAAGVIKVSDDFDVADDGTLTLYTPIAISSFSNNSSSNEIGKSISSSTFSWTLNKKPDTLAITSQSLSQPLTASQTGSTVLNFSTPLTSNTSFTLTAKDSHGTTRTTSTGINFYHKKYCGVSSVNTTAEVDDAFVLRLTGTLTSSRTGSFTVTANSGQYIYFAVPASFGTPSFFVGGFEGGFSLFKTFDFTNASGNKSSYNVYKSTNAGLGNTTVEVK